MKISATQHQLWTSCQRAWFFSYVCRLPSIAKGNLDFGTVTHSVCERWLSADETGRVPKPPKGDVWTDGPLIGQRAGAAVELYPEGWETIQEKARGNQPAPPPRTLPAPQAAQIKKLVAKAIEEGVLERSPGRRIEYDFTVPLIDGVEMGGKIDVLCPGEIQDHKTTKAMKWAKSPKGLQTNLQMLDYAAIALRMQPQAESIRLRHNVFCTDPFQPIVRKVETSVTRGAIERNWAALQEVARGMKALADSQLPEDDWREIKAPTAADACNAYGGCPFLGICGGSVSPAQYRERTLRQIQEAPPISTPVASLADAWDRLPTTASKSISGDNTVDVFQRRKAALAGSPAQAPAAPKVVINGAASAARSAPAQQVAAVTIDCGDVPPWAQPSCPACKGTGFSRTGGACRMCDTRAKRAGGSTSADFHLEYDGHGVVAWSATDGSIEGATIIEAGVPAAVAQVRRDDTPVAAAPAVVADEPEPEPVAEVAPPAKVIEAVMDSIEQAAADVVDDEADEADDEPAPAPEPAPKQKPGRPKAGYYLYIDCMPTGVATTPAETLFDAACREIAEIKSVGSYYELNAFARRDLFALALTGDECSTRFNRMHIVVRNPSGAPDLRAFVDALIVAAQPGRVIQGLS